MFGDNLQLVGTKAPVAYRHRLGGTVTVDGSPAKKRVIVVERATFAYVAGTWSNPTDGVWSIAGVAEYPSRALLVLAFDDSGEFNCEAADYISQVAD